jgi:heparanase 1
MDYGLLDEETLKPRPDYWNSLLWRRLMGPEVYPVSLRGPAKLRVYAHSAARGNGICLLAINLDHERSLRLNLPQFDGRPYERYRLTAPDVLAGEVRLNGAALLLLPDGRLPAITGELDPAGEAALLPPLSYGFFVHGDRQDPTARLKGLHPDDPHQDQYEPGRGEPRE